MKVPLFVSDAATLGGQPFIAGTRIAITDVLGWRAQGKTIRQITKEHLQVSEDAVRGAVQDGVLVLEAQGDGLMRRAALDTLLEVGYGSDTEDPPSGPPKPPDMGIPTGYMGRVQGK